jgi:hypothetical protein
MFFIKEQTGSGHGLGGSGEEKVKPIKVANEKAGEHREGAAARRRIKPKGENMEKANAYTYDELMKMEPRKLLNLLTSRFYVTMPEQITTVEDMERASKILLKLSANFSYLQALCAYAKFYTREQKRSGDKKLYEDAVDRRDIVENITDAVKQEYAAISRAVTIHTENNQELRMNATGAIR